MKWIYSNNIWILIFFSSSKIYLTYTLIKFRDFYRETTSLPISIIQLKIFHTFLADFHTSISCFSEQKASHTFDNTISDHALCTIIVTSLRSHMSDISMCRWCACVSSSLVEVLTAQFSAINLVWRLRHNHVYSFVWCRLWLYLNDYCNVTYCICSA